MIVQMVPGVAADVPIRASYPTNLQGHLSSATGQITLTWNAPLVTGSSPIIGYVVYRDGNLAYSGTDLSFTEAIVSSSTHSYSVSAVNGAGEGAPATYVYNEVHPMTFPPNYPYCLDVIHADPLPWIRWECLLPPPI
jgi:hypothetical protein